MRNKQHQSVCVSDAGSEIARANFCALPSGQRGGWSLDGARDVGGISTRGGGVYVPLQLRVLDLFVRCELWCHGKCENATLRCLTTARRCGPKGEVICHGNVSMN